jgi:hypothetical protein
MCSNATGLINSHIVKKEICAAVRLSKQAADLSEKMLRKAESV